MKHSSLALTDRAASGARYVWMASLSMVLILSQALMAEARGVPGSFADLAEQVSPSVVNITTSTTVAGRTGPQGIVPEGSPFEDFFREFQDRNRPNGDRPRRSSALGSGFVISEDGFIVTNNHVIKGGDEIYINFDDGRKLKVDKVLGKDAKTDLALLKVTPKKPLKAVPFGSSDDARVCDWVMAIGNPFGLGGTVTVGIVSAKNRDINSGRVFGGWVAGLSDHIVSMTMGTALEDGEWFTTTELQTRIFRPVGHGLITIEGRLVSRGRTTGFVEADWRDEKGRHLARISAAKAIRTMEELVGPEKLAQKPKATRTFCKRL